MEELGRATEPEMVLAFLQAEIDSPTWGKYYAAGLERLGRALIARADLTNTQENEQRRQLLRGVRGYPDQALLTGFPRDTAWRRARLARADFALLRYGKGANATLDKLSRGTRRVMDAAANFDHKAIDEMSIKIRGVMAGLRGGQEYPPLIAVESGQSDLILVEGYTRATAYAILGPLAPVEFLIGSSPRIGEWQFH